ncbi:MAG: Rdx family protein [Pseudomonadota bacterium]
MTHRVVITYCPGCRWLPRATWVAQELLTTFADELTELSLRPGNSGVFDVSVNDRVVWTRRDTGRFPELAELKRLVRNEIAPEKDLGHSERSNTR